jgi:hypothetical protein
MVESLVKLKIKFYIEDEHAVHFTSNFCKWVIRYAIIKLNNPYA